MKRKFIAFSAIVLALGLYVILGGAESVAVGSMKLRASVIDYVNQSVVATGKASFTATSQGALPPGTMRLDSIQAESIRVDLVKGKDGKFTPREAVASGGVTIKAKRADVVTDSSGNKATVLRDLSAVAKDAAYREGEGKVTLSGNVTVKVTEPGIADPVAVITGNKVLVILKENRIRVEGRSADDPAQFTYTQREK